MHFEQDTSHTESASDSGAGVFLHARFYFLANSHQNSHSPKIKMAADLAASHLADFIGLLAPQVGLEPTTLRLTAECSLLRSRVNRLHSVLSAIIPPLSAADS